MRWDNYNKLRSELFKFAGIGLMGPGISKVFLLTEKCKIVIDKYPFETLVTFLLFTTGVIFVLKSLDIMYKLDQQMYMEELHESRNK